MAQRVTVADFASVLQIVVAVNFLLLYFNVRPILEKGWRGLESKFDKTLREVWVKNVQGDPEFKNAYARLTVPMVFSIGLEFFACLITAAISAGALALLIQASFDRRFAIDRRDMTTFLCVAFASVPAYYTASIWLMAYSRRKLLKVAKYD